MENLLTDLKKAGYLEAKIVDGEELFHLTTPCRFRIDERIVTDLRNTYKVDEEIGGVFWAKPTTQNGEIIYLINKVVFIRNAIEDHPRTDNRSKSNSYLPDSNQLNPEINEIIKNGCLPVKFHTHPTKGTSTFLSLINTQLQTETSDQDIIESLLPHVFEGEKLLMPRALIVGNDISRQDIFIGVYSGFIAPESFEDSKLEMQQANIQKTADIVSTIQLTDGQRFGLSIGAVLLLISIIKYPKYSLPVIIGLLAILPSLMSNTQGIDRPNYFNKLSVGSADIFIPKAD